MVLLAHMSDADIRRYLDGGGNERLERHVRVCVNCAQRLGAAAVSGDRWERRGLLGRLVRIDASRVVDELLAEIEYEQRRHAA
jgi:hypothetical protein